MKKGMSSSVRLAIIFLSMVILFSIFADFIANDSPILVVSDKGVTFFESAESEALIFQISAPISYRGGLDLSNTMLTPLQEPGHILGTDHLGRDILAGIIHGSRTSLGISVVAIVTASIVGLIIGGFAGFFGDRDYSLTSAKFIFLFLMAILGYFFIISVGNRWGPFLISTMVLFLLYRALDKYYKHKRINIPVDMIALKFIEVFSSIPTYFLVIALVAFVQPNWFLFAILIGLTSWVGIAKLTRAEMIRIRSMGYIESAEALGLSNVRIFFKHALPNAVGPLPYALTFGIAGIVVLESTLSYFGVGLPADSLSWGNFLSGFKNNSRAWWVVIFPGLMIFLTILSLHITGRWLDVKLNPKEPASSSL